MTTPTPPAQPRSSGRRLSKPRVALAALIAVLLVATAVFWARNALTAAGQPATPEPWFAGYVDVTATPSFAFETPVTGAGRDVVLSFIVASTTDDCEPSWGTYYSMDEAATELDLDRRIARLGQQGGEAIVSFGGIANDELATSCTDHKKLVAAYTSVVDRYSLSTIDIDVEAGNLTGNSGERRAKALAQLQADQRAAGEPLAIWLTLPVAPTGLTEDGTDTVAQFLAAGVDLAGVNAMTMDYGSSRKGATMLDASTDALEATHRQLGILYDQSGTELSDATLWSKIGATPMIGQNDVPKEIFDLEAAMALNSFALEKGIGRMSMWSLNRDKTCGANYVDLRRVSDSCSGIPQGDVFFADLLGAGFDGRPVAAAATTTSPEPTDPADLIDDPATSPYQIWTEEGTYLKGTKVVWHHSVYEAKWWNSGELPDNPVLNSWETPWELIGPVLPGEKPITVATLPGDTYPLWASDDIYEKDARVMHDGVPFQAKWWTQGNNPSEAEAQPDDSPWIPLTQEQVQQVLSGE